MDPGGFQKDWKTQGKEERVVSGPGKQVTIFRYRSGISIIQ
jgi:hypothetical protein